MTARPDDGGMGEAGGFRFRPENMLFRGAFAEPVIDAEGITRSGLFMALRQCPEIVRMEDARLAAIADDPAVILCILGHSKFGEPALVAFRGGVDFTIHKFGPSSDVGTSMMAEGAAPSSAAPHKAPHIALLVAS